MNLRAVFFDMGGTIETYGYTYDLRLKATSEIRQKLEEVGVDLGLSDETLLEVVSNGLQRYHDFCLRSLVEISSKQVWREYILAGFTYNLNQVDRIAEELTFFIETHYYQRKMRPDIPIVLMRLQQLGLKIGIISNVISHGQVPENLKKYGIKHYFSPIVLSCEYGYRKPNPAIFHYAARIAQVPTSACLYVGDRIARDILGAKEAGYKMAIQISHDFDHGEVDEGAVPDAVIHSMSELLDILQKENENDKKIFHISSCVDDEPCAVLFDAGDILYHRPRKRIKLQSYLKNLGRDLSDLDKKKREEYEQLAFTGLLPLDDYREATIRCFGITDPEQIQQGVSILYEEDNDLAFFDGVADTLQTLKTKGYLLGIITDTAASISEKLKWFKAGGFGDVWDTIISSAEIGVRKPDARIYHAALNQLGISAQNAVFVGHKATELEGARNTGMKTVAFNYELTAKADYYIEHFSDLLKIPVIQRCNIREER